jgi:4-amino-4-deoxychorismate lyase
VLPAGEALIPATDSSVMRGDGVFETVLVTSGNPLDLAKHQARLAMSAAIVEIDTPPAEAWTPAVDALIAAFGKRATPDDRPASDSADAATEFVLRLTSTRSGQHFATAAPVPARTLAERAGISVILAPDPFHRAVPYTATIAKTLSYATNLAAQRYARARGADDVIFLQPDGTVTEGPTATVVFSRGGELITPAALGILPGITAARLTPRSRPVTAQDLATADSLYLVSAVRLAAPIVTLDGYPRTHDAALTEKIRRTLLA